MLQLTLLAAWCYMRWGGREDGGWRGGGRTKPPLPPHGAPTPPKPCCPYPPHPPCTCRSGRVRNACLLYTDVAMLMLGQGQMEVGCCLLEQVANVVAYEGW